MSYCSALALHIETGEPSTNYLILERLKGGQGDWKVSAYPPTEKEAKRWSALLRKQYKNLDFVVVSQKTEVIDA